MRESKALIAIAKPTKSLLAELTSFLMALTVIVIDSYPLSEMTAIPPTHPDLRMRSYPQPKFSSTTE
jgi:hypothetical protein